MVTGGASGMGRLSAWRLAAAGAQVAILDVNEAGLRETKGDLANVHAFPIDVTDARAVFALVRRIESELGPIDRVMARTTRRSSRWWHSPRCSTTRTAAAACALPASDRRRSPRRCSTRPSHSRRS
jgi:nucleoside-diphosphate-sugar epimerase